ncbi:hypothetical protein C8F01DRAFT_1229445 [Mycena amicta]|nr:hypothetical protein C8F01DRAFT_1229445 [Mycena amicta]
MACFVALLVLIIVALELLNNHLWQAYDLQTKLLLPWAILSRGFSPAENAWLLDYTSANVFQILFMALKFRGRHLVVLLTTLGVWATALAGIVTTSLFQVQDLQHTFATRLARTTALNTSVQALDAASLADSGYTVSYLGRQVMGVARNRWVTTDNIVMESFANQPNSESSSDTLLAETLGYSADLNCTTASVSYAGMTLIPDVIDPVDDEQAQLYMVNVTGSACTHTYNVTDTNIRALFVGTPYYYGQVVNHTCADSSSTMLIMKPASSPLVVPWESLLQDMSNALSVGRNPGDFDGFGFQSDPWPTWGNDAVSINCDCDPWFFLVGHGQNLSEVDMFSGGVSAATLANASRVTFAQVWSDYANSALVTPPANLIEFEDQVLQTRTQLMARSTSIRIAEAAVAALAVVAIAVYFLQPKPNLPINPASIAAQAVLLQASHAQLTAAIRDTATMNSADTRTALKASEFAMADNRSVNPKKNSNWMPPFLHIVFRIFLVLLLAGAIVTLELTLRRSVANNGFADLPASGEQWWTYISPAFLFLLGILLASYTFNLSSLEPYFAMARSPQPASRSVRYTPQHYTHVELLFHATRYRSYVGLCCAMVALIVPFTKIAVSGLLTTSRIIVQNPGQVAVTTEFNMTSIFPSQVEAPGWLVNQFYPGYVLALSTVKTYSLALPAWTTTQGAIANIDLGSLGQLVTGVSNTTVTLPLPVMRGQLEDCAPLVRGVNLTLLPTNEIALPPAPSTLIDGNAYCVSTGKYNPSYPYGENITLAMPKEPGWFGTLHHGWCIGGYYAVFGKTEAQNATAIEELTVVQCPNYSLTQSTRNVALAYVDQDVDILSIDSEAQDTIAMPNFLGDESGFLTDNVATMPDVTFDKNASHAFDTFMQLLVLANTSVPLETFLNATELAAAMQPLYSTYWAIYATHNLILPASPRMVDAVVNSPRTRITQARIPTRILQGLLGAILVLTVGLLLLAVFVHRKSPLPKPPYSIGATMAMLADSRFVEIPELGRVRNEAELDAVVAPYDFVLGWGENSGGGRRFGVDVDT